MEALLILLFILIFIGFFALLIGGTVFWVLMLLDAARRNDWQDEAEKIIWLVLMIAVGLIPAVIYYFVIVRARGKAPA